MSRVVLTPSYQSNRTEHPFDTNQNKSAQNGCNWKVCAAAGGAIALCGLAAGRVWLGNSSCPAVTYTGAVACPTPPVTPPQGQCDASVALPTFQHTVTHLYSQLAGKLNESDKKAGYDFLKFANLCNRPEVNDEACIGVAYKLPEEIQNMKGVFQDVNSELIGAFALSESVYKYVSSDFDEGAVKSAYEAYCKENGLTIQAFEDNMKNAIDSCKSASCTEFLDMAIAVDQYPFNLKSVEPEVHIEPDETNTNKTK